MAESRLELKVIVQREFGRLRVFISTLENPDECWKFDGVSHDVGEAFRDAYVQLATQLSFDGMAQCRICTTRKATHILRFPDGKNSQIRCEECAKLSIGYPKGWEVLEAK